MRKILILDDHPYWQALINTAIKNGRVPDTEVIVAKTFSEAAAVIGSNRFAVALLDYRLAPSPEDGNKNGLDVARLVQATDPSTKILLVTVAVRHELVSECEALGIQLVGKHRDFEEEIIYQLREALADYETSSIHG